jgi:hypothetical protein
VCNTPGSPPAVAFPAVPTGLTLAQSGAIGGSLTYSAGEHYALAGQVAGPVAFNQRTPEERPTEDPRRPLANALQHFLTIALVGLLLLAIGSDAVSAMADIVEAQPFPTFGWGLLAGFSYFWIALALAIASIFLAVIFGAITLGGLAVLSLGLGFVVESVLFAALIVVTSYVAQAVLSYWGGRWILQRIRPDLNSTRAFPLLLGLALLVIASAVPVLGGLLQFIVAILGLGAACLWIRDRFRPAPATPSVAIPLQ